jgi:hypothetical protein
MPSQDQINKIKVELNRKGFATNCKPDDFYFLSHTNVKEYLSVLNAGFDEGDELYSGSIELDEPWGNCVAIIRFNDEEYELNAKNSLDNYADIKAKEFNIPRSWK